MTGHWYRVSPCGDQEGWAIKVDVSASIPEEAIAAALTKIYRAPPADGEDCEPELAGHRWR